MSGVVPAVAQQAPLSWNPGDNHGMSLSSGNYVSTWSGGSSTPFGPGGYVRATTAIPTGAKQYFSASTSGFYAGTAFTIGVAGSSFQGNTGDGSGSGPSAPDVTTHWDGIVDVSGAWVTNPHRASASMQDGGTIIVAIDRVANTYFWKTTLTNNWNDDPSADPSKGTGGIDISSLGGAPLYPVMVDGSQTGPSAMISGGTVNDPSLAGFTSMDAAAGTTTSIIASGGSPSQTTPSTGLPGAASSGAPQSTPMPPASVDPSVVNAKPNEDGDCLYDDGSVVPGCDGSGQASMSPTPPPVPTDASIISSVPTVAPNAAVTNLSTTPNAAAAALLSKSLAN